MGRLLLLLLLLEVEVAEKEDEEGERCRTKVVVLAPEVADPCLPFVQLLRLFQKKPRTSEEAVVHHRRPGSSRQANRHHLQQA